ncbi:hypothetical protein [Profundibacter sp.]
MDIKPQRDTRNKQRGQPAQEQYTRKIGYMAYRLKDLKSAPAIKPETKQKPFVITDWASI